MCAKEDSDQPAHLRSLIKIFTVYSLDTQSCFHADNTDYDEVKFCLHCTHVTFSQIGLIMVSFVWV